MAMELKMFGLNGFVDEQDFAAIKSDLDKAQKSLHSKTGAGNEFLGWMSLPKEYDKEEFCRIEQAARKIQQKCDVLVVIGIGGSYLGARAAIEFVNGQHYNAIRKKDIPEIYFAGNNISSAQLNDIIQIIGERDFAINMISKSGMTTEPAIAFRALKQLAEQKYGKEKAKEYIFATTDKEKGALKKLADEEGYETFVVPNDVGGRYSVLTAVGLLPIAAAGIDIRAIMQGAEKAMDDFSDGEDNICAQYAALRNILYRKGKQIEILVGYEPALMMFGEWFKQLFAESEGKGQKGLFPASANFSTDLHSIGQFIQDGTRNMFETVLWVKKSRLDYVIEEIKEDVDGLNYLAGKSMQDINKRAYEGTVVAHIDGGTPNILMEIDEADAWHFGYLAYFFEKACAISGYMLGVNPFDQPGVEMYKKNMFALLGKSGYEKEKEEIEKRLQ